MTEKPSLGARWRAYRPSKAVYVWSCIAAVAATMVIGFTWGGWVTGATAADRAKQAAQVAEAQLAGEFLRQPVREQRPGRERTCRPEEHRILGP